MLARWQHHHLLNVDTIYCRKKILHLGCSYASEAQNFSDAVFVLFLYGWPPIFRHTNAQAAQSLPNA